MYAQYAYLLIVVLTTRQKFQIVTSIMWLWCNTQFGKVYIGGKCYSYSSQDGNGGCGDNGFNGLCMLCIHYTIFLFSTLLRFNYCITNLFDNLIKLYTVFTISTLLRFVRAEGDLRLNSHSFNWTSLYFRMSVKVDLRQRCDIYVTTWVTTFLSLPFNL